MDLKKILIISSIILILSLTAVSATDLNDVNATEPITHDTHLMSSIENNNVEQLNATTGSFNDLQVEINNAPEGSVLNLTRDYMGHYGSRIQFNKDLTIDGQGHTLDCLKEKGCSAFYSSAGTIILKNLKIINGHNDYTDKGGGVYIYGSGQYSLINCTFDNNWADDYGGAIYNEVNKPLTVINCTFSNNKANDYSGGAIYSVGDVYISNTKFIKNSADVDGGAVYTKGNVITIQDIYESNQAKGASIMRCFGGAIYSEKEVKITNSTFRKNYAENWGGAIKAITVTITGSPSFFDGNTAGSYGGAIQANKVTNDGNYVLFTNNKAENDNGGAIHANSYVYLENTTFIKNSALVDGGAIFSDDVYLVNDYFESNEAKGAKSTSCFGGAVRAIKDVKIKNSTFYNNYAENKGGAVYANTVTFEGGNSYFDHNTARDYGGAIFANEFTNDISYVSFTNNNAGDEGGAVYIFKENWITFSQCVFANNKCNKKGGAILLFSDDSHLTLRENIFIGNSADEGEAVYNYGHYDSITNNFWGSKNPSSDNEVLIEWKPFLIPNIHHSDSNPLKINLDINSSYGDNLVLVSANFYNSNGNLFNGKLFDLHTLTFNITPNVETKYVIPYLNCVDLIIMPELGKIYNIAANLYGYTISKTLDLTKININAPEITTTYGVPAEFKIHIDGEKNLISNQKIIVSLDSTNYEVLTDVNGNANLYFNNYTMYPGTYDILIKINNVCMHSAITILPNITIVAPKISSYYGSGKEFRIHLDGDKRFTANQNVKLSFNYRNYEIKTDENGDASIYLDTSSLAAGNYVILINILNINAKSEYELKTTIEGENIIRIYGDHTPFYATFRDSNGNYLPDCELFAYSIDNSAFSYMNVFGNEGKGSCAIAYLYPGYHFITLYNFVTREYKYYDINILPQVNSELQELKLNDFISQDQLKNNANGVYQNHQNVNNESILNEFNQVKNAPTANTEVENGFTLNSVIGIAIVLMIVLGSGVFIIRRKLII